MADAPDWDDIPEFDALPDAPQGGATPAQSSAPNWDDIPDWDALPQQKPESFVPRVARRVANDAIPAAAGYSGAGAGAELGATIGTAISPGIGTVVGGVLGAAGGAMAAGYAASRAQQAVKEAVGLDDSTQQAINAEEHPGETFGVDLAVNLAGMRPDKAATMLQRGAGALLGGGMEAGQEYAQEGKVDPMKVATTAAGFAAFPSTNRLGSKFEGAGRAAAGKVIPGRPNVAANPEAAPVQDEAASSQQATVTGENSLEQPPPQASGDTTGNPQSAPVRSSRFYKKGPQPDQELTPDMLTKGDMPPDVAEALGSLMTPRDQTPGLNPGEQLPIKTGIVEAAQQQGGPQTEQGGPQTERQAPAPEAAPQAPQAPGPQPEQAPAPEVAQAPSDITSTKTQAEPQAREPIATEPEAPPWEDLAAHPADAAREAAKEATGHTATPGQKAAENYKMGHSRLFGREVSWENAKGSTRASKELDENGKPIWTVENLPYDYGHFKGTKGADSTPAKLQGVDVMNVGTGDKHFVVDQRNTETGKFDEHKVIAHAKDIQDAVDHYNRGFSDDRGPERLGSIKEASADGIKKWLAAPGAKKKPFDPNFKEGASVGPSEGTKPLPKVVTAAVKKLNETVTDPTMRQKALDELMAMEPSKQLGAASKIVNETDKVPARPDRIRGEVPTVEGLTADDGTPITARSKADAAAKSADVKKMNDAYAGIKFKDAALPTTKEEKAALRQQVQDFHDAVKDVKYKPAVKHEPYLLARAAKKLLVAKNPTDKSWQDFMGTVKQLASGDAAGVRSQNRTDSDIGLGKNRGDEAIANAEAARASPGRNAVEDAMIERLDAKKFETPHEEAEALVKPEPASTKEDVQRLSPKKGDIDISQFAKKTSEREAPLKPSEERSAGEGRKIDIGGLDPEYLKSLVSGANKKNSNTRLDNEDIVNLMKSSSPTTKGLIQRLAEDEGGWVNLDKVIKDLKLGASKLVPDFSRKKTPQSNIAREPTSQSQIYARSLSNDLHKLKQADIQHRVDLMQWAEGLPKELNNPETLARLYHAREENKIGSLSAEDQKLWNDHLEPMFKENDQLFDNINAIKPDYLGPEVENHIYRIADGEGEHNILRGADTNDPIETFHGIATRPVGTMMPRKFFSFEAPNGARLLASISDDGFSVWHNRYARKINDPSFQFKANENYTAPDGKTFVMREATTPQIEQHGRFGPGQNAKYYHNAALSAAAANNYLGNIARHLQFLEDIKKDPTFRNFAAPPGAKAPDSFIKTDLANFKDWKMDPQLAHVLDDYAQPGINHDALNTLRGVAQAITKTIFWLPMAHLRNVGEHWFVGRAWDWIKPEGYRSLAQDGAKAVRSVVAQDDLQRALREHGAGTIYGGVLSQGFFNNMASALGEAVKKNPSKWDPIARQFGMGPSDLARAVYRASSKIMWAGNDMFLTQAVLEHMRGGMSMQDAITSAERHIPNYRIPATVMGSGRGARIFSQLLSEPTVMVFGRYHYGVFNSYANIAKDLVKGDAQQRLEAVGNLFALGLLALAVYPAMNKIGQLITGNDKASVNWRGPLAIPAHALNAMRGKEDIASAGRSTFTLSPLVSTATQQLSNKDFRGKDVIERGDLAKAAKGDLKRAGRVAASEADFLGRGLVSPYGTLAQQMNTAPPSGTTAGRARQSLGPVLDVKTPSQKAVKYEAQMPQLIEKSARQRAKNAPGPLEKAWNSFTR